MNGEIGSAVGRPLTPSERDEVLLDRLQMHLDSAHDYYVAAWDTTELYAVKRLHNELHDRADTAIRHDRRSLR